MKGDFSRWPQPDASYVGVLMQQGRVVLDSDWNEQARLVRTAQRMLARDLIGAHGAPHDDAGFEIELTEDGTIVIGRGSYYVDGQRVENKSSCAFEDQPYFDGDLEIEHGDRTIGTLYYLDVWERYVDAVGDAGLADPALGGPDTTGRIQTVWQVRRKAIDKRSILADPTEFREREREIENDIASLVRLATDHRSTVALLDGVSEVVRAIMRQSGRRATRTERTIEERIDEVERAFEGMTDRPAALRELEELTRELIEAAESTREQSEAIRDRFAKLDEAIDEQLQKRAIALDLAKLSGVTASLGRAQFDARAHHIRARIEDVSRGAEFRRHALDVIESLERYALDLDRVEAPTGGDLVVRDFDVLHHRENGTLSARTKPENRGYTGSENLLYRIEIHNAGEAGTATFKWSRDNGFISARIDRIDPGDRARIALAPSPGGTAQFPRTAWVEILDRQSELAGRPGTLVQIDDCPPGDSKLKLSQPIDHDPTAANPFVIRRWDTRPGESSATHVVEDGVWIPIEHGIEVAFSRGPYRCGDYWMFAARTARAAIDWPLDEDLPSVREPLGIRHTYAPLALIEHRGGNPNVYPLRNVFEYGISLAPAEANDDIAVTPIVKEPTIPAVPQAIHIVGINWTHDDEITVDLESDGLALQFDLAPDARCATPNAFLVVAEPYEKRPGVRPPNNHTPVSLNGKVTLEERKLVWRPEPGVLSRLTELQGQWRVVKIMLRITLRGHAIWTESEAGIVHLSGRALHQPTKRHDNTPGIGLMFPTGQTEAVSDFESWCYL